MRSSLQPAIVAHRGLHGMLPENSLAALIAARRAGFLWECDVHRSADGEAVVIHDPTLNRTTAGTGAVRDYTWKQLREFQLKGADGHFFGDERLSRLAEVIQFCGGGLVEIKPPNDLSLVHAVADVLQASEAPCRLISFDRANVDQARALGMDAGILVDDLQALTRILDERWDGPVFLNHVVLNEDLARRLVGLPLSLWTVNEAVDVRRVLHLAGNGLPIVDIITDHPHAVRECLSLWRRRH